MPARDNNGAVRYFNFGNFHLNDELKEFNMKKLEERGKFEG